MQKGYIWQEGNAWFCRYRVNVVQKDGSVKRIQRAEKLAERSDKYRTERDVRPLLQAKLMPMNEIKTYADIQLGSFVEQFYFPYVDKQKHKSTAVGYREKWKNYLKPYSAFWMRGIRTCDVQKILYGIADRHDLSSATIQRCKSLLSGIFSFAKQQGYFDGVNPVIGTEIPSSVKAISGETYAYSIDEINRILLALPNPAHAIVAVASYAGLSRSEIEGLCWENYNGKELSVTRGRVHGVFGEPKTLQRKGSVPVIPRLKKILNRYKLLCGDPATGVMFANGEGNPVCLNNVFNRIITPALNRCEVCWKSESEHHQDTDHKYKRDDSIPYWHGYHACRRGLATNLHALEVDDLTIQRIMRHASVTITQRAYIKTLPKQVTDAMDKLEQALPKLSVQ